MLSAYLLLTLAGSALAKPVNHKQQPKQYRPPPAYGYSYKPPTYDEDDYVTKTTYKTHLTKTLTRTIAQPSNYQPGTVIIGIPASYTTTTCYDPSISTPVTVTVTQTVTDRPGTVIVTRPGSTSASTTEEDTSTTEPDTRTTDRSTSTRSSASSTSSSISISSATSRAPILLPTIINTSAEQSTSDVDALPQPTSAGQTTSDVDELPQPTSTGQTTSDVDALPQPTSEEPTTSADQTSTNVLPPITDIGTSTSFDPTISQPATTTIQGPDGEPLVVVISPVLFTTSTIYDPSITDPTSSTSYIAGQPTGIVFLRLRELYETTTGFDPSITSPSTTTLTSFVPGPPPTAGLISVNQPVSFTTSFVYDSNIISPVSSTVYTGGASGTIIVTDRAIYSTTTSYALSFTAPATRTPVLFAPGPPLITGTIEIDLPVALTTSTIYDPNNVVPNTTTSYVSGPTAVVIVYNRAIYVTTTSYALSFQDQATRTVVSFDAGPPTITGTIEVDQPVLLSTTSFYDPLLQGDPVSQTIYTSGPRGEVRVTDRAIYTTITSFDTAFAAPATRTLSSFQPGQPPITGAVEVDLPAALATTVLYDPAIVVPSTSTLYESGASTGQVRITSQAVYDTSTSYILGLAASATRTVSDFQPGVSAGLVEVDLPVVLATTTVYDPLITEAATNIVYVAGPSGVVSITSQAVYITITQYLTQITVPTTRTISSFVTGPPTSVGTVEVDQTVSYETTSLYSPGIAAPETRVDYTGGPLGTIFVTDQALYTTITNYGTQFTNPQSRTNTLFSPGPPAVFTGEIELDTLPQFTTSTIYSNDPAFVNPSLATNYVDGAPTATVLLTASALYTTQTLFNPALTASTTITRSVYTGGPTPGLIEEYDPVTYQTTTTFGDFPVPARTTQYADGAPTGLVVVQSPAPYVTITVYSNVAGISSATVVPNANNDIPGTVAVTSPIQYATSTSFGDFPAATVTTTYDVGSPSGTVVLESPAIVTIGTSFGLASSTSTVVPPGPSQQGSVVLIVPATEVTLAPVPQVASSVGTSQSESFTVPVLPTVPVDQPIAAPTACNNQGLQWADYPNTNGDWFPTYSTFNPSDYKLVSPRHEGVTDSVGGFSFTPIGVDGTMEIYNGVVIPSNFWVINHQGYIYPGVTGDYTFTSYNADDIVLVWIGPLAFAGWERSNANLEQVYDTPPQGFTGYPGEPPVSFTVTLTQGVYYPIRIMAGQAGGQAEFHLVVQAPDGTEFLGPQTGASPYLVQYSCDGTSAPQFPRFGTQLKKRVVVA